MRPSALLCFFALVCAGCGPDVDLTKALHVEVVSTGWFDAGIVNGQNKLVNGTLSIAFMKDPNDPQWNADASMKLYRKILNRYAPGATGDSRCAGNDGRRPRRPLATRDRRPVCPTAPS